MKKKLQNLYLLLIVIFLYAPIMTLMVLSFNSSRTRAKWGGFTGKWYVSLFQDEAIMSTLYNTLIIALLSALIATVIGTLASIGIQSISTSTETLVRSSNIHTHVSSPFCVRQQKPDSASRLSFQAVLN